MAGFYSGAAGLSRRFRGRILHRHSQSERLWRELERETQTPLLSQNGVVSIGPPDNPGIQTLLKGVEVHSLDSEILDYETARQRYPVLNLAQTDIAVRDRRGGILRSQSAVVAAIMAAKERGALVTENTTVSRIDTKGDLISIGTSTGEISVRKLIVTAGAWSGNLLGGEHPALSPTPHAVLSVWFRCRQTELFSKENFPAMMRFWRDSGFAIFPSYDGETVKAGLFNNLGPILSPSDLTLVDPTNDIRILASAIEELYPDLNPVPVRYGIYPDGYSIDGHAFVGNHPSLKNVLIGTGFSGHGFKTASAVGAALADMALESVSSLPIEFLRVDR